MKKLIPAMAVAIFLTSCVPVEAPQKEEVQTEEALANTVITPEDSSGTESSTSYILKGTAAPEVTQIRITGHSENCQPTWQTIDDNMKKVPGGYEWEYKMTNEGDKNGILCKGKNKFTVDFARDDSGFEILETKEVTVNSDIGRDETPQYKTIEALKNYQTNSGISVENDPGILTTVESKGLCEESGDSVSYIPLNNSDNVFVKEGLKLEFFEKVNGEYKLMEDIPPLEWGSCEFSSYLDIYFYDRENIVVYMSPVFESYPSYLYLEDGEWKNFEDLLKTKLGVEPPYGFAPFGMKADRDYISLTEKRFCCDSIPGMHPGLIVEVIFDANTKEIVDVLFGGYKWE